jgi:hypothetical protein
MTVLSILPTNGPLSGGTRVTVSVRFSADRHSAEDSFVAISQVYIGSLVNRGSVQNSPPNMFSFDTPASSKSGPQSIYVKLVNGQTINLNRIFEYLDERADQAVDTSSTPKSTASTTTTPTTTTTPEPSSTTTAPPKKATGDGGKLREKLSALFTWLLSLFNLQ